MNDSLLGHLTRVIAREGPISVGRYMAEALGHPSLGYYMRKDPFGPGGDFITAPEISQVFGELIGLWCAEVWRLMGSPDPVLLVELGPGRGTLIADLLRAARIRPAFEAALDCHLVESSPLLKDAQRARLTRHCIWHASFDTVPRRPMLLIANEFFDALPVRQVVRGARGWHERRIDVGEGSQPLRFINAPEPAQDEGAIPAHLRDAPENTVIEVSPERSSLANAIGSRLAARMSAALIIDYGHTRTAAGDTLQAIKGHRYTDPLDSPGEADLTAHVDFEALASAAQEAGAAICGPVEQGIFLKRLGIERRTTALMAKAGPPKAALIAEATRRLTAADRMGSLFKVMAIRNRELPSLPGF